MGTGDVASVSQAVENYGEKFSEVQKSLTSGPAWLHKLRGAGFDRFCEVGFPTTRDEDWRFTNISSIAKTDFSLVAQASSLPSTKAIEGFHVNGAACALVFVDGHFAPG